ncbi:MAG: hypothetical protein ACMUJM_09905 [bacterium]
MKRCPVSDKKYDQDIFNNLDEVDIKHFENQVAQFMRQKLDLILIKSHRDNQNRLEYPELMRLFYIEASEKPLYQNLNRADDVDDLIAHIIDLSMKLGRSIGEIVYKYKEKVDREVYEHIQMLSSIVKEFIQQMKQKKGVYRISEKSTVKDMQYQFYGFLKKNFDIYLLDKIIPPILDGIEAGHSDVYELILKSVNEFLSHMGIITLELREDQEIDYELWTPLESDDHDTGEYTPQNRIKKIIQLPYVFDRNHMVKQGKIIS